MIGPNTPPHAGASKEKHVDTLSHLQEIAHKNSMVCLEEAKRCDDELRAESLEALAVQRALIAQQIGELMDDEATPANQTNTAPDQSLAESDLEFFRATDRLYNISEDQKIRSFLRDIRTNLGGLAHERNRSQA